MRFCSVTRLRLRAFRFIPMFLIATNQIHRQVRQSSGFIEGWMSIEGWRAFWTITVWDNADAMRAFRNSDAHQRTMLRLVDWCDEASFAHWETDADGLPSIQTAYQQLRDHGSISKVRYPTPAHLARQTVSDAKPRVAPSFGPDR